MRAGSNWRHLNGLSLGMMGDPVRCLPKVVHPDVAALKLQHNLKKITMTLAHSTSPSRAAYLLKAMASPSMQYLQSVSTKQELGS